MWTIRSSRRCGAEERLLTPQQIREGREALGLQSKELAERLGVAKETLSRWETGMMIQSRAMDNLLRAYFAVPEVRAVLQGPNQDVALGTPAVAHPGTEQPTTDAGVRSQAAIRLIDLISLAGINLANYKIHCATGSKPTPLEAFFDGKFKQWQEDQNRRKF